MNISNVTLDELVLSIMDKCEFLSKDAIMISDFFDHTTPVIIRAIRNFDKYNDSHDVLLTLSIDVISGINSYSINKSIVDTPFGYDLNQYLKYIKNNNINITVDTEKYLKENTLPTTIYGKVNSKDTTIHILMIRDILNYDKLLKYVYDSDNKDTARCDLNYKYSYTSNPDIYGITKLIQGISKGLYINKNAINTDHIMNGSITSKKLSDSYAKEDEIIIARQNHKTLGDRLDAIVYSIEYLQADNDIINHKIEELTNKINNNQGGD